MLLDVQTASDAGKPEHFLHFRRHVTYDKAAAGLLMRRHNLPNTCGRHVFELREIEFEPLDVLSELVERCAEFGRGLGVEPTFECEYGLIAVY